jgi:small subunit ribosomal protein S6
LPGPEEVSAAVRPYEIVVIFDAGLDEQAIRDATDRLVEQVKSRGGTSGRVDRWGKRTLAYEIAHKHEGYYVVIDVDVDAAIVAELDRVLRLDDEVLRHKILRKVEKAPARPRTPESPPAEAAAS